MGKRVTASILMLVVLSLVPSLAVTGATNQAAESVVSFTSTRNGNSELYQIAPGGGAVSRVTRRSTTERDPAVSVDGQRIAYTSNSRGDYEIYVAENRVGARPVRATTNTARDSDPSWSPNGNLIAFTSNRYNRSQIFLHNLATGRDVQITRSGTNTAPSFSPDGRSIAFTSNRDGNDNIYTMSVTGRNLRRITTDRSRETQATWSPDGQKIAFTSNRTGNWEINVIDLSQGRTTTIARHAAADLHPAWSPDGDAIAFQSKRSGNWDIWIVGVDGTGLRQQTTSRSSDFVPSWGVAYVEAPPFEVSVTEIDFRLDDERGAETEPGRKTFEIVTSGSGAVEWTASENVEWLTLITGDECVQDPEGTYCGGGTASSSTRLPHETGTISGTETTTIAVRVSGFGLPSGGVHTGTFSVSAGGVTVEVTVTTETSPGFEYICDDHLDNDGDGLIDSSDTNCDSNPWAGS